MDLTKDALPNCDLIRVRDCFIHLSFESIFAALRNITQSKIRYLLTTHHVEVSKVPSFAFFWCNGAKLPSSSLLTAFVPDC